MLAQHLAHGVGIGLFVAGAGTAIGVIAASLVPQWPRICRLALGHVELMAAHAATTGSDL